MAVPVRSESTDLRPWDSLADVCNLLSRLSRFTDSWGELVALPRNGFTPLADVEVAEDAHVIEIELPGVDKKDIDVSVAGRRLTITGEREEKERVGVLRRRTRRVGSFEYDIQLPGDVDDQGVTASLTEGVLTARVPRRPPSERARSRSSESRWSHVEDERHVRLPV